MKLKYKPAGYMYENHYYVQKNKNGLISSFVEIELSSLDQTSIRQTI